MRVLVTYADDDGAAEDTAQLIGDTLAEHGLDSTIRKLGTAVSVGGYDAVIIGSTARFGQWLRPASRFALAQQEGLREMPVWLYSNSYDDPSVPHDPIELGAVEDALTPRDHRPFAAATAPATGWSQHALEPDPGEVRGWAHQIAATLQATDDQPPTPAAGEPGRRTEPA
ncbi:flavodoxin domain-containing protein [Dactylosporangium sp. NPDC005572]|uniref:flavodoxin domain-containing protein n=1 Tax=Dactylosporangium sp. NPDC005572 TaxID=3156889 RepID=UPI0033BBA508